MSDRAALRLALCLALSACAAKDPQPPSGPSVEGRAVEAPAARGGPTPIAVDPGRVTLRRLNAREYDNTVRDLLGTARRPSRELPPDDTGYGFDNIGDVLSVSPLHVEQYGVVVDALVEEAMSGDARGRVVGCAPSPADDGDACLREVAASFGRRAWRRPLTAEEVDALLSLRAVARAQGGGFEDAARLVVRAILMSPRFVFRVELDPDPSSPAPHPLDDHEVAARLSYFLWSSTPDDALLDAADAGALGAPEALRAQVARMIDDPRSRALAENFAGQWLRTRALDTHDVNPEVYAGYDASLRDALRAETEAYFDAFLRGDEGMERFLTADFTFANEALARHYGLAPLSGDALRRVSLAGTPRSGALTQGALLTVTSNGERTSPVRRGLWVLSQLLCTAPPPPPANTPPLDGMTRREGSVRDRTEAHRANPGCASCHQAMDPIGFAFEHFDGVGRWRDDDSGFAIDTRGALPSGETFDSPAALGAVVASDPRYARCVTRQLMTYALGRGLTGDDDPTVDAIAQGWRGGGMRLRDLVTRVVLSDPFRLRRGEPARVGGGS